MAFFKMKNIFKKVKQWHDKEYKQTALCRYDVKLQRHGDNYAGYNIRGIVADSEGEAIERAKRFVAQNGWWSIYTNIDERMKSLSCVEVKLYTEAGCDGN